MALSVMNSAGTKEVPVLLPGASVAVAVDISPTMPDTDYSPAAAIIDPASALTALDVTNIAITDTNTVTVTVYNNGLVSLGNAVVGVTAIRVA